MLKDSINNIIEDADKLCEDILLYNNEWDMEQCNIPYKVNWKKWDVSYNGDAEWVYMRSRMEYMNKLLIAYENTFNIKYLDKWDYVFVQLVKYVTRRSGIYCNSKLQKYYVRISPKIPFMKKYCELNRRLDVAIRNFILCDRLNANIPETKYKKRIIKEIRLINIYIHNTYTEWDQSSNWGLIEILAVIYGQFTIGDENIEIYEQIIDSMLDKQFYSDYSHIECSPMYVVEIQLSILRILYRYEDGLSAGFLMKLRNQCYNIYCFLKDISVNAIQPIIGDSDLTDLNTVFFLTEIYLFYESKVDIHKCNIFTLYPYKIFDKKNSACMKNNYIAKQIVIYPDSGIAKLHNTNIDIHVTNGPCNGGHEHFDSLSFTFYYQGHPIVIDSGRYTYRDCWERYYLRSEFAHNTCIIDHKPRYYGSGVWGKERAPFDYCNEEIHFGSIYGIFASNSDCKSTVSRFYLLVDNDTAAIITMINQKGFHVCQEKLHINYNLKCNYSNNLCVIEGVGVPIFIKNYNANVTIETTIASQKYNCIEEITCINFNNEFRDFFANITIISSVDSISIEETRTKINFLRDGKMYKFIDKKNIMHYFFVP